MPFLSYDVETNIDHSLTQKPISDQKAENSFKDGIIKHKAVIQFLKIQKDEFGKGTLQGLIDHITDEKNINQKLYKYNKEIAKVMSNPLFKKLFGEGVNDIL